MDQSRRIGVTPTEVLHLLREPPVREPMPMLGDQERQAEAWRRAKEEERARIGAGLDFLRGLGEFAYEASLAGPTVRQAGRTVERLTSPGEYRPTGWDETADVLSLALGAIPGVVVRSYRVTEPGVDYARREMEKKFPKGAGEARRFVERNMPEISSRPNFGLADIIARAERTFNDPVPVRWSGMSGPEMEKLLARYGRFVELPGSPNIASFMVFTNPMINPMYRQGYGTYHKTQHRGMPGNPVLPSTLTAVVLSPDQLKNAQLPVRWNWQKPKHAVGHELGHAMDLTSGLTLGIPPPGREVPYRSMVDMPVGSPGYDLALDYLRFANPGRFDPRLAVTSPDFYQYVREPYELSAELLREALTRPAQLPVEARGLVDRLLTDSANTSRVAMPWW